MVYTLYHRILQLRPPPLCILASGKTGEEAYSRDSDIYMRQQLLTNECHMGTRSLHFLWLFDGQNLRKSDKVSHNMTQVHCS